MRAEIMGNPGNTTHKINGESWIKPHAEPLISSGDATLSDEIFANLLDKNQFGAHDISAEILFEKFYKNGESTFFQSFRDCARTLESFRRNFADEDCKLFIDKAEKIVSGKFDLLGFENLDFGAEIDWHFEPVAGVRSPLKHWKQFDEFSTEETGDRQIIFELNRCQHFFTLGVAFQLTGDERFAETFARHLDSWLKQNPPGTGINWSISSEVALRSISWVWALHFFKSSTHLTPELFLKTLESLDVHARHIEKYLSTYYSPNIRLTGEALGLYYLGTQIPFFERAAAWRQTGEEILLSELDRQILPDGVYFEQSSWYQRNTTDFYTHFYVLNRLNGGAVKVDLQLKLEEKLQSSLDFLMFVTRPDGTTALVGDDDGGKILPLGNYAPDDFRASLSTGAAIFRRGDYKFVARRFAAETLWLLGADGEDVFENLPAKMPEKNSAAFKDGGYFVMRDGWTETDNYLLVDGGDFAAGSGAHAHADALSIDAAIGGKTLLVDAGTYTFNETNGARNHFRSTEAHNTLVIDGQSQSEPASAPFSWQTQARTTAHRWISQERFDFFEGSHDGYERFPGALAAKHTRSILFLKNDYWIMRDFVETAGEHKYALNFHFDRATNPAIETTEKGVCVSENSAEDVGSKLFSFGDNAFWKKEKNSISTVYGKRIDGAPLVKFISKGVGSQEFFTFLLPNESGFAAPEVSEISVVGGRAFIIAYRDYRDVFVFADGGNSQSVRTGLFNTNFQFSLARLSEDESLPEEFVLIGGTDFSVENRQIIKHHQPLEWATARRFGNDLNVRTSDGDVFSRSLAQKKTSTYVLKK